MLELYCERQPRRVLEIGCWQGGTLREWLRLAVPAAHVVAVDLEHRNWRSYLAWGRPDVDCVCVTGRSQDPEIVSRIESLAPFDWVFIDGDHSDAGVRADVVLCLPLVVAGGALLLHDIEPPEGTASYPPGVLFAELTAAGYATTRFVDPEPQPCAHGVGVVFA